MGEHLVLPRKVVCYKQPQLKGYVLPRKRGWREHHEASEPDFLVIYLGERLRRGLMVQENGEQIPLLQCHSPVSTPEIVDSRARAYRRDQWEGERLTEGPPSDL
jgi:hypothetical protein